MKNLVFIYLFTCVKSLKISYVPSILVKTTRITQQWSYSDFTEKLKEHQIEAASILDNGKGIIAIDNLHDPNVDPSSINLHAVISYQELTNKAVDILQHNSIPFDILLQKESQLSPLISFVFGFLIFNVIFRAITSQSGNGLTNPFQKQNSFDVVYPGEIEQRFKDVAGIDSIKNEVIEVVDYLKQSDKYDENGIRVPKGVLLEGPPGVGKTLLARATAGEANVPFISMSGSQFIEVFVGVGAQRVRNLFNTARSFDKCIIFIDEIDAIGKQRSSGGFNSGGNDEREQTLNQILTEMDGFKYVPGVIVMAATNRIDLLDSALVRPGRFDRKISVPLPNIVARKQIIKTLFPSYSNDEQVNELASLTNGFSGASISNLINEALILSIRNNNTSPSLNDFINAYEKIQIGLPVENTNIDSATKELVAYHEAGHALCAMYFNSTYNVSRVTIRPTSNGAGGYTLFTPDEKLANYPTKKYLLTQMILAMGGKAAEEILYRDKNFQKEDTIFDDEKDIFVTSGAVSDLQQVNQLAETYITKVGFGNKLTGYSSDNYLTSEYTKSLIDVEKENLVSNSYDKALTIIEKNKDLLTSIAQALIQNQTIRTDTFSSDIIYV